MIVDIEERLGIASSANAFAAEYEEEGEGGEGEGGEGEGGEGEGEEHGEEHGEGENEGGEQLRTDGQRFRHTLMQRLLQHLA